MFISSENFSLTVDCALPFSWKVSNAYAHPRAFDAISFRVRGNADYTYGGKHLHADTNDILFVPAHQDYLLSANVDESVLVIHFFLYPKAPRDIQVFHPSNPDVFYRLFTEACAIWRTKELGYRHKITSLLYKIFEQIEIQQYKAELPVKTEKLQEAVTYLHENFFSSDTTVESTAAYIGTSTVYLRKLFHAALNESPLHYLTKLRIAHAQALLKTGYYSVEEVTTLSGFNDSKYFSTLYKKYTGYSPSRNYAKTLFVSNKK